MDDAFQLKRLCRVVEAHREKTGTLPQMSDLEAAGFEKSLVKKAVSKKILKELYTDMTTGAVVKVYKVVRD